MYGSVGLISCSMPEHAPAPEADPAAEAAAVEALVVPAPPSPVVADVSAVLTLAEARRVQTLSESARATAAAFPVTG
jgi:hypothetical protein